MQFIRDDRNRIMREDLGVERSSQHHAGEGPKRVDFCKNETLMSKGCYQPRHRSCMPPMLKFNDGLFQLTISLRKVSRTPGPKIAIGVCPEPAIIRIPRSSSGWTACLFVRTRHVLATAQVPTRKSSNSPATARDYSQTCACSAFHPRILSLFLRRRQRRRRLYFRYEYHVRVLHYRFLLTRSILTRCKVFNGSIFFPRALVMVYPIKPVKTPSESNLRPDSFNG